MGAYAFGRVTPAEVLTDTTMVSMGDTAPGVARRREITEIWLQSRDERSNQRRAFRKMAKDMGSRYLTQMDIFRRRGINTLNELLATEPESLTELQRENIARAITTKRRQLVISDERWAEVEKEVDRYLQEGVHADKSEDVRLGMLNILMERYAKRVPQGNLFEETGEAEPSRPVTASSAVADGSRIHLMHKFKRAYYYGIDTVCDASSENAEQFLQLVAPLVARSETQLIRSKAGTLRSKVQHELLRERAGQIILDWDFPDYQLVRRLADKMSRRSALAKSLEGNASLGGGATAVGIPQR